MLNDCLYCICLMMSNPIVKYQQFYAEAANDPFAGNYANVLADYQVPIGAAGGV